MNPFERPSFDLFDLHTLRRWVRDTGRDAGVGEVYAQISFGVFMEGRLTR